MMMRPSMGIHGISVMGRRSRSGL